MIMKRLTALALFFICFVPASLPVSCSRGVMIWSTAVFSAFRHAIPRCGCQSPSSAASTAAAVPQRLSFSFLPSHSASRIWLCSAI